MNDRIDELAKQCYAETGSPHTDHFQYWKFAELIVKECVDVCRNQYSFNNLQSERENCAADIEEHFGVKE